VLRVLSVLSVCVSVSLVLSVCVLSVFVVCSACVCAFCVYVCLGA
jgi:hypothetical protein